MRWIVHLTFVAKSDISLHSDSMECGGSGFLGGLKMNLSSECLTYFPICFNFNLFGEMV